jgi:4a-hydroxytetrahydrobiopterin dehydratase
MTEQISPSRFHESPGVEDWRVIADGACTYFRTDSLATGARLAQAISELDGVAPNRPDIDLRYEGVSVLILTATNDYWGMTTRDVELARQISLLARDHGVTADLSQVQAIQFTIDALVSTDVMPFWRAVLGYVDRADSPDDLLDPRRRGPSIWFQDMDAPRPQRNRIHVDVWVPHDQAEARVAAALAAGGTLVSDKQAPSGWVLADAEGNEVCIASVAGRD